MGKAQKGEWGDKSEGSLADFWVRERSRGKPFHSVVQVDMSPEFQGKPAVAQSSSTLIEVLCRPLGRKVYLFAFVMRFGFHLLCTYTNC